MNNLINNNTKCIENEADLIDAMAHVIKWGRPARGSYGDGKGIICPHCGCKEYPVKGSNTKCTSCGGIYAIPEGY